MSRERAGRPGAAAIDEAVEAGDRLIGRIIDKFGPEPDFFDVVLAASRDGFMSPDELAAFVAAEIINLSEDVRDVIAEDVELSIKIQGILHGLIAATVVGCSSRIRARVEDSASEVRGRLVRGEDEISAGVEMALAQVEHAVSDVLGAAGVRRQPKKRRKR